MSFNKSRRRIAGLLSILTAMGTTLAGRNFMVSAAVAGNYFTNTEGSALEKDVKVADEKYLILKVADRPKWPKNITDSDKVPDNATDDKCGKDSSFLNVEDNRDTVVFDNKSAGTLFKDLKDEMKKQSISDRYTMMLNLQARNVQNQLDYNPETGVAKLHSDMSISLAGDSVKDKVVYFHYGEKVYATTANILFQAQALTGEILTSGETHYVLAKECPLSAAMLVGVATANAGGEKNGIAEVAWMKYVYSEEKKLNGKYALKPSQDAVKAQAEYVDEEGEHHDAVEEKKLEYTFGDVKTKHLLEDKATTGKEDIKGDLGANGLNILIKKDNKAFTCESSAIPNAYKSKFTVTRNIDKTFGSLESAKMWLENNKGKLWGIGGTLFGGVLGVLITSLVLGQNSFSVYDSEDDNDMLED